MSNKGISYKAMGDMSVTKVYHIKLGGYVSNKGISYKARALCE